MSMLRGCRWLVALALLASAGCLAELSDPMGRQAALKKAQLHYTQLVRWGDLERARAYVHPEVLDAFDRHAAAFEGLRITDYEIGEIQYGDAPATASVTVTYRGYSDATLVEKPIRERQQWEREGLSNTWRVRPELDEIVGALTPSGP